MAIGKGVVSKTYPKGKREEQGLVVEGGNAM